MDPQRIIIDSGEINLKENSKAQVLKIVPIAFSLLALVFSLISLVLDASHKEATLMPYLQMWFNDEFRDPEGVGWYLYNAGLGPAVIERIEIKIDGSENIVANLKDQGLMWDYFYDKRLEFNKYFNLPESDETLNIDGISIGHAIIQGDLIKIMSISDEDMKNIDIKKKKILRWLRELDKKLDIIITYESIKGDVPEMGPAKLKYQS